MLHRCNIVVSCFSWLRVSQLAIMHSAEWVKMGVMDWNETNPGEAKLNSKMWNGKSAMSSAKVRIRSELYKEGHRVIHKYRSPKGVGWLESKWQRGKSRRWRGDCVTKNKVHCGVCNALKMNIKMHCSTHTVTAFFAPLLLYSILLPPSLSLLFLLHVH